MPNKLQRKSEPTLAVLFEYRARSLHKARLVLAQLWINQTEKKKETKNRNKQKRQQGKCFGKERVKRCYFSERHADASMDVALLQSVSRNYRVNSFRVPKSNFILWSRFLGRQHLKSKTLCLF